MTYEDEQYLMMGKEVARMIVDVGQMPTGNGFAQRRITFRGGHINMFLATDVVAAEFNKAADAKFNVRTISMPEETERTN